LPRLRRFAVALTGNLDQGDDLVQETFMRALSRVDLEGHTLETAVRPQASKPGSGA
jgi:DNA-directed RNA polymerase specialized sigma24 family protein